MVLGSVAAQRLGLSDLTGDPMVWIGDRYYTVVGILEPVTLHSSIDRAALIGLTQAEDGWAASPAQRSARSSTRRARTSGSSSPRKRSPEAS